MRLFATIIIAAPFIALGCLHAPGGEDECECPLPSACLAQTCEDGACVATPIEGSPPELQVAYDCQTVVCDGSGTIAVPDPADVPDDFNACTLDLCSDGVASHQAVTAGTPCDAGFCTAAGECLPCDDGNACTSDDCSSGAIVSTQLPEGTACADGGVCDATGFCFICDDGNPCTADDCSTDTPVHTELPYGTSCGGDSFCDQGTCVSWCVPLPDPVACVDSSPYEATDDVYTGEPQFADDDGAPRPICGLLTPGDEDWISYYAEDRSFENDVNDFLFWSFSEELRVCAFAKCDVGGTEAPCYDGGVPTTGPEGQPGCCWQGVFDTQDYFSMNLSCDTDEDSGWVRIRIDNPNGLACAPYALRDYGY